MRKHGAFDTDASALERRIDAHVKFGSGDLNQWILGILAPQPGHSVLDLGCGTGNQSIPLTKIVGPDGNVTSVDISSDALAILKDRASEAGVAELVTTTQCSLDEIPDRLGDARFDRVVASYSLYYAGVPGEIIRFIHRSLRPHGRFFFCGPANDNNRELKTFHNALKNIDGPGSPTAASQFLEVEAPRIVEPLFAEHQSFAFENPLSFDSAAALYDYWTSYNLFDADLEADFLRQAERHFRSESQFTTVKRVRGILAEK